MNKGTIVAFVIGAAAGSLVTWKILKDKYEKIYRDEIDEVKERLSKRDRERRKAKDPAYSKDEQEEYSELTGKYSSEAIAVDKGGKEKKKSMIETTILNPDEFGENDDYELLTYTYYADGVLTDEFDEPLNDEETEDTVGTEFVDHFGEYEDDTVYVRNDQRRTDYEILRDNREYSVAKHIVSPRTAED